MIVAGALLVAAGASTILCNQDGTTLAELSGLARSRIHAHVLWATNDSGDEARIYGLDERTCRIVATVRLAGVSAIDQEALASGVDGEGNPVIWVGDIGDNAARRDFVTVRMVPEPARLGDSEARSADFRFRYPDGPVDAESLIADPKKKRVWVITKESRGRLFRIPLSGESIMPAEFIAEMPSTLTDAATSPDGSTLIARDYISGWLWRWPDLGTPTAIGLPLQPQSEAITWTADGKSVITGSERSATLWTTGATGDSVAVSSPASGPASGPASSPASSPGVQPGDQGNGEQGNGEQENAASGPQESERTGFPFGLSPSLMWIAIPALGAVGLWTFRRR